MLPTQWAGNCIAIIFSHSTISIAVNTVKSWHLKRPKNYIRNTSPVTKMQIKSQPRQRVEKST